MITTFEMKTMDKSPYIDEEILDEIKDFMGEEGEETVSELISIFLRNTPNAIAQIGDDLFAENYKDLRIHVHGLKGSSSGVGAIGISSICRTIEDCLLDDRYDELNLLFEKLINVYMQVETIFRERY